MGVPKFYRWISERYPCLSEIVKENQIPEFDNLYLDMNGIIHTCSHPNDDDPHFRITEAQIFQDIFRYLEVLFRIIRPRKRFFMAVDGVAPRAKMNQQRGRRFMSAKTAQDLIEKAESRGEKLPKEDRFDSNCITPGTSFMAKLHEQLKYFVNMKISTDEMWQGIRIYLSGHDVPGEGEHKIMDFIRNERSQPEYDPHTRHCLYGLDADLIMLGLCSHEPYFCLLREEIKFVRPSKKGSARTGNAEQTTFHLLHLTLLRDYIELEFSSVKEKLPFDFDLECIIDDWVLMGFLVGNDFIPHLPNLHIHSNALPALYKAYKTALPELGGYINEGGYLNLTRFEKFMSRLSSFDRDAFQDEYEDIAWLDSKRIGGACFASKDIRKNVPRYLVQPQKPLVPYADSVESDVATENASSNCDDKDKEPSSSNNETSSSDKPEATDSAGDGGTPLCDDHNGDEEDDLSGMPQELQDLIRRSNAGLKISESTNASNGSVQQRTVAKRPPFKCHMDDSDEDDDVSNDDNLDSWSPDMETRFMEFKSDYYKSKMNYCRVTPEVLHDQAVQYVRAIQWNLHYYYNGVCSWSWYYPHHYAPYLSDVKGFSHLKFDFDLGEPFVPFQQLLAVLPAASKTLLPSAYQVLMTDSESPLIDFYPSHFETDLNGKKNDWEAVILIPFIKEDRLLQAMRPLDSRLTDEEKMRNRPGKHLLYTTAAQDQGFYRSSLVGIFPDLNHNKAICKEFDRDAFQLPREQIKKGLLPGLERRRYIKGFSTLKQLPYKGELADIGVLVFQQNSKNESLQITLLEDSRNHQELAELADQLLGKEIYVNWPHLSVGMVRAVSDSTTKFVKDVGQNGSKQVTLSPKERSAWEHAAEDIQTRYSIRRAVEIGEVFVLVEVYPLLGKRFTCNQKGEVSQEKQWAQSCVPYAVQTVVTNVQETGAATLETLSRIDDLFPVDCSVFLISNPFYGCEGTIKEVFNRDSRRFKVAVTVEAEPDFSRLIANQERIGLYWYPGWQVAQKLDISGHVIGRITGTVYITDGSTSGANRHNIGLNLKFSKKNEEVPDYTKRDSAGGVWLYSTKVLKIMDEYARKFPEVFDRLQGNDGGKDVYSIDDFWNGDKSKERLKELLEWLKSLPCYGLQHQSVGSESIDERVIRVVESAVEKNKALHKTETKLVAVRPNALFRTCMSDGNACPDPRADYYLFDRVVCAREGYTVPVGLRGTVVGVHPGRQEGDLKLSVIFDDEFIGGVKIRSSRCSGYHIAASALVNLTYGWRIAQEKKEKEMMHVAYQRHHHRESSGQQGRTNVGADARQAAFIPQQHHIRQKHEKPAFQAHGVDNQGQSYYGAHCAVQTASEWKTVQSKDVQSHHRQVVPAGTKPTPSRQVPVRPAMRGGGASYSGNEVFPAYAAKTSAGIVFVNSNVGKDSMVSIEERNSALRSLLSLGGGGGAASSEGGNGERVKTQHQEKIAKGDRDHRHDHEPAGEKRQTHGKPSPREEPRVSFTARQLKPPSLKPMFAPAESLAASTLPQQQPSQWHYHQHQQPQQDHHHQQNAGQRVAVLHHSVSALQHPAPQPFVPSSSAAGPSVGPSSLWIPSQQQQWQQQQHYQQQQWHLMHQQQQIPYNEHPIMPVTTTPQTPPHFASMFNQPGAPPISALWTPAGHNQLLHQQQQNGQFFAQSGTFSQQPPPPPFLPPPASFAAPLPPSPVISTSTNQLPQHGQYFPPTYYQ